MPDRPFTEEQTTSFGSRLHPQIESRPLWAKPGPLPVNSGASQPEVVDLDDCSALSSGAERDVKVTAVYLRTSCERRDLRVRTRGADPDDILDFRVLFPGACDGCRVRRRRAACSERLLHKERRKPLNLNMLFFFFAFCIECSQPAWECFRYTDTSFFQYFVLGE